MENKTKILRKEGNILQNYTTEYISTPVGDRIRIDFENGDYYFGCMKRNIYHG